MKEIDGLQAIYQSMIDSLDLPQFKSLKAVNMALEETIGIQIEQLRRISEPFSSTVLKQMSLDLQKSFIPMLLEIFTQSAFPYPIPEGIILPALSLGIESLIDIQMSLETDMLKEIKNSFINAQPMRGVQAILDTIGKPTIDVADISFLTLHRDDLSELLLTKRGLTSVCNNLNKGSARKLLNSKNLSFDQQSKSFFLSNQSDIKVSISEINTICAATTVLEETGEQEEEVTVEELVVFCELLEGTPTRGSSHAVGQKIDRMIKNWPAMSGFDRQVYYHSRSRNKGEMPYSSYLMTKAPWGIPGPGRYNSIGQAYYYFADTENGAKSEVRKYAKDKDIQTAVIKPVKEAKLVDLSGTVRRATALLRYIRFPVSNIKVGMPREYLIPTFVSDCCRSHGFDGIKYYGGDGYSNYVTWKDHYFEHVKMIV